MRREKRRDANSILFSIFNRETLPADETHHARDSIVVEIPQEDEPEVKKMKETMSAVELIHDFIFSRITFAKGLSCLSFIFSATMFYLSPQNEDPLSTHKLLLLPVLDVSLTLTCCIVYILMIHQIHLNNFVMLIVIETVYTMVALMMIQVSAIIVVTWSIEARNIVRFCSACLALVAVFFQMCSGIITLLKYRPIPRVRTKSETRKSRASQRFSQRWSERFSKRFSQRLSQRLSVYESQRPSYRESNARATVTKF